MGLTFKQIEDDKEWDNYVFAMPNYSFLNSSARYTYNKNVGIETFRYAIFKKNELKGIVTGNIGNSKLFGKFLECKHSPMLLDGTKEEWREVTDFLKKLAKENSCFMLRFSPLLTEKELLVEFYKENGFIKAPIHNVDALISQQMDLSKTLEELRREMNKTRRNLLNRLLENKEVTVKILTSTEVFDDFARFHDETVKFKGYVDKPTKLLMKELEEQQRRGMCYMVTAYYEGKPFSIWQNTVYGENMHLYQAGASTDFRLNNLMVTTLLFWKSLELGKELGLKTYDLFGGVVPNSFENKKHPWRGVSEFKRSLGGTKVTYMHSRDYPLNKVKYYLYHVYSTIRTKMKGHTTDW